MNTDMTLQMHSTSSGDTEALGAKIGANLRGGEVIELISDLGGGKTTLTRGLVRGAGSKDRVASPTFTISREYQAPNFTIAHFDFYRLGEAGIVADELAELVGDPTYVVVVEWGDVAKDVLPADRLTIRLSQTANDERTIVCTCTPALEYVLQGVEAC